MPSSVPATLSHSKFPLARFPLRLSDVSLAAGLTTLSYLPQIRMHWWCTWPQVSSAPPRGAQSPLSCWPAGLSVPLAALSSKWVRVCPKCVQSVPSVLLNRTQLRVSFARRSQCRVQSTSWFLRCGLSGRMRRLRTTTSCHWNPSRSHATVEPTSAEAISTSWRQQVPILF